MKKEDIGIYRFKRHDESMVGIYDKSQLNKKEVEKICSLYTSHRMVIMIPYLTYVQVFGDLFTPPKKYKVLVPFNAVKKVCFEASDVKEVEGGFFATIKMSNGASERNMYYYGDGCSYEEVEQFLVSNFYPSTINQTIFI